MLRCVLCNVTKMFHFWITILLLHFLLKNVMQFWYIKKRCVYFLEIALGCSHFNSRKSQSSLYWSALSNFRSMYLQTYLHFLKLKVLNDKLLVKFLLVLNLKLSNPNKHVNINLLWLAREESSMASRKILLCPSRKQY